MHDRPSQPLQNDAVQVWWFALDDPGLDHDAAHSALAEDEAARARRMRKQGERDRWIVARATLRQILGSYVGIEPRLLRFSYGIAGKPDLSDQLGDRAPHFSLSHAGSYALCAVARGCPVGVDVEVQSQFEHDDLARHRFTPQEVALLASLPAGERATWFVQLWTYKEAYVKARGLSLDAVLNGVVIMPSGTGTAAILRAQNELHPEQWTLRALPVKPGYCGAVAFASAACSIEFRAWPATGRAKPVVQEAGHLG